VSRTSSKTVWQSLGTGLYSRSNKDGTRTFKFRARFDGQLIQETLGHVSLQSARELAAELRDRLRRETLSLVGPRKDITIEEVLKRRRDDRQPRTCVRYQRRMKEFEVNLCRIFGKGRDAMRMTRDDVRFYIKRRLEEDVSPSTINRELCFARSSFRAALFDDLILKNPFDGIERLPEPESDTIARVPDEKTISMILARADAPSPWLRPLVMTLIGTGERVSAVLTLKRSLIDFPNQMIYFPAQTRKGRRSKKQPRLIPISIHLARILSAWTGNISTEEYVFSRRRGVAGALPMPLGTVRSAWIRAARRAGFIAPRIHDLRHFAVSQLGKAGLSASLTREFIGHRSDAMTRRYMHLNHQDLRGAAEILGGIVAQISASCVPGVYSDAFDTTPIKDTIAVN
jgi:integrase